MYKRPEDHCCVVYHGENYTDPDKHTVCWPRGGAKKGFEKKFDKYIKGVDCGKNTWIDLISDKTHPNTGGQLVQQSLAGRIAYEAIDTWKRNKVELTYDTIRIGPYDDQIMPALMLFDSHKRSDCSENASRHFYDPRDKYPGEF